MQAALELLAVVALVSALAVLQYFKGRRENLLLLRHSVKVLEGTVKPEDKVYHWVGLYVGYKGVLWIREKALSRLEVTLLLLPRYSAFYYPVSKIINRFDRVYLTYWFTRFHLGEAHLVREGAYRRSLEKVVSKASSMNVSETVIKGVKFHLLYRDSHAARVLMDFVKSLGDPSCVNHVASVPTNKSLYIYAVYDASRFEDLVQKSFEWARSLAS